MSHARWLFLLGLCACIENPFQPSPVGPPPPPPPLDHMSAPTHVTLPLGGSVTLDVGVWRGSHVGPIVVTAVDLPTGVSSDPITLTDRADRGELTLRPSPQAKAGYATITIVATANELRVATTTRLAVGVRPGMPDPTFADGGIWFRDMYFVGRESPRLAPQPDGGTLVVMSLWDGRQLIVRLDADGRLDPAFTEKVLEVGWFLTAMPDGAMYFAGGRGCIWRVDGQGAIDPTFGAGGTSCPAVGYVRTLIPAPDGKLLMVHDSEATRISRLLADGSLDPTFEASELTWDVNGGAVAADGSLLLVGSARSGLVDFVHGLRIGPTGTVNTAYTGPPGELFVAYAAPFGFVVGGTDQARALLGWTSDSALNLGVLTPGQSRSPKVTALAPQAGKTVSLAINGVSQPVENFYVMRGEIDQLEEGFADGGVLDYNRDVGRGGPRYGWLEPTVAIDAQGRIMVAFIVGDSGFLPKWAVMRLAN